MGELASDRRPAVIVKLGGSLLTDKKREAHARTAVIDRLAGEIAEALPSMTEALVLGHGSGSFGHVAATREGLSSLRTPSPTRPTALGASRVQRAAAELHGLLRDALLGHDVPAWSWSPSSVLVARGGELEADLGSLDAALCAGLVPVVYGDVVVDRERRAAIASTEDVVDHLVTHLSPARPVERLLWLGETEGIWDASGRVVPRIDAGNVEAVRGAARGAAGTDVTGGMLLRLDTAWLLARRGIASMIVDGRRPGLLAAALRGESVPGTLVAA